MDYNGGRIKKNPKALIGTLIAIIVIGGLVFWVLASALRENWERPPDIGHSHTHSASGGSGPAPTTPPTAGPDGVPIPAPTVDLSPKGVGGGLSGSAGEAHADHGN